MMQIHHSLLKSIESLIQELALEAKSLASGNLPDRPAALCIDEMLLQSQSLLETLQQAKNSMHEVPEEVKQDENSERGYGDQDGL